MNKKVCIKSDGTKERNPDGYTEISLPEKELPRWMMVWDYNENNLIKRFCIFIDKNDNAICIDGASDENDDNYNNYINNSGSYGIINWNHYKEIPEVNPEKERLEKQLAEMKAKVEEMETTLKEME